MKKQTVFFVLVLVFLCSIVAGCTLDMQKQGAQAKESASPSAKETAGVTSSHQPGAAAASKTPVPSASLSQTTAKQDFTSLAPTTVMAFSELVGDNGDYREVSRYPDAGTYKLVVNVYYQFITAYKKDAKGEYSIPARYMVCSTGAIKTPTPVGSFEMGTKRIRFGKFMSYGVYGQYWSQITRSIYFHSLLYTKRDADTYTKSSYRNLGKRVSHGCIRMLVPDARWIYYNIAPGTKVDIIRGKKDTNLEAIKNQLVRAALPAKRPKLVKGDIPVTEPWPGYTGKTAASAGQ
jgi:lipoprotein-anchoring transpeptidase ErfK/SrfK